MRSFSIFCNCML